MNPLAYLLALLPRWLVVVVISGVVAALGTLGVLFVVEYKPWQAASARYEASQSAPEKARCEEAMAAALRDEAKNCGDPDAARHLDESARLQDFLCRREASHPYRLHECEVADPGTFASYAMRGSMVFITSGFAMGRVTLLVMGWVTLLMAYVSVRDLLVEQHRGWRRLAVVSSPGGAVLVGAIGWMLGWSPFDLAFAMVATAIAVPLLIGRGRRLVRWVGEGFRSPDPAPGEPPLRVVSGPIPASPQPEAVNRHEALQAERLPEQAAVAASTPASPAKPAWSLWRKIAAAVGIAALLILGLMINPGRSYATLVAGVIQATGLVCVLWVLRKLIDWWQRRR